MKNLNWSIGAILLLFLFACKSSEVLAPISSTSKSDNILSLIDDHPVLQEHFVGFVLYDPISEQTLVDKNGDLLFTPASNIKLLTYFVSKQILKDTIPALSYLTIGDSLIFQGTGDPLFLSSFDQDSVVFRFFEDDSSKLFFDLSNYHNYRFGSGWAWDDNKYAYQKEKTSLPIFGNGIRLEVDSLNQLLITPHIAKKWISIDTTMEHLAKMSEFDNAIELNVNRLIRDRVYEFPIRFNDKVLKEILIEELDREVYIYEGNLPDSLFSTIYHNSVDSIYKALLVYSDNFIAEQLLLCVSNELFGSLNTAKTIQYVLYSLFEFDNVRWVDGSGLSRYNLISPQDLIKVLININNLHSDEEIKNLFPYGQSGSTVDSIYLNPYIDSSFHDPFIYAKTGTLSNNHNMSGFIYTHKGHKLIFSFMNNHYYRPKSEVVRAMHEVLSQVYWQY